VPRIEEQTTEVAGLSVRWRRGDGPGPPVVYLHGVPTSSADWIPFLERTGGIAPDLPGFGRSDKPAGFDYSIGGYGAFLQAFLDAVGVEDFRLVVHDWGVVGLALAQRFPERVRRLVIMNAVPLLPGHRWHRVARVWRRRGLGELAMGAAGRRTLPLAVRALSGAPLPEGLAARFWPDFDHGTQRAILRLYRSAPPDALEAAGTRLGSLEAPALVLWGEDDPFLPTGFAHAYGAALPSAEVELVPGGGHWPWLERPEVTVRAAAFLDDAAAGHRGPGER
jgi:pimeloyl-ACP methyl ester carboxylesterase